MADTLRARVKLFNQGGFGKLWSQVPFERRLPTVRSHEKAATFIEADRISAAASRAAACAKVHNLRGGIRAMEDTPSAPPDDASHAALRRLMLADAPPREQGSAVETWTRDRALHDPTPRLKSLFESIASQEGKKDLMEKWVYSGRLDQARCK